MSVSELNIEHEGESFPKSVEEQVLWNPELSGIQDFLYISSSDQVLHFVTCIVLLDNHHFILTRTAIPVTSAGRTGR